MCKPCPHFHYDETIWDGEPWYCSLDRACSAETILELGYPRLRWSELTGRPIPGG